MYRQKRSKSRVGVGIYWRLASAFALPREIEKECPLFSRMDIPVRLSVNVSVEARFLKPIRKRLRVLSLVISPSLDEI